MVPDNVALLLNNLQQVFRIKSTDYFTDHLTNFVIQKLNINNAINIEHSQNAGFIITKEGNVFTYGSNRYGRLGLNMNINIIDEPIKINGLVNIIQI